MSKLAWYWHRLRAMSLAEMALHARKKIRQWADARHLPDWSALNLEPGGAFPRLPKPEDAPQVLREALRRDADDILAGRWKAFGHLDLKVDDPPKWYCDYLVGRDLSTTESAFKLNHRSLPGGADIKLIWELSRWHHLVRLAMTAYVLGDARAAAKCVEWLEDWVKHNSPYRGWNWTSALEAGMRLIQFVWIDALLSASFGVPPSGGIAPEPPEGGTPNEKLGRLRRAILPPHVWFAWRHRSFGSSANNHLLGELAGLIVATVRWPELEQCGAPLKDLRDLWSREVTRQFADDGGNREQALNYQLFSWELCWQAFTALETQKLASASVEQRLSFAARFFWEVQARSDHWDYGDSDNAFVVPFFARTENAVGEWHKWFEAPVQSAAIAYWLDDAPTRYPSIRRGKPLHADTLGEWWMYPESGIGVCESGFWWMRWDLSPLGYLATAAHGHLDALHLSIWYKGVALIVDPGTGAYYAEPELRAWLASRAAHNAPCADGIEQPRRLGPFLWAERHRPPSISQDGQKTVGVLSLAGQLLRRAIEPLADGPGWLVKDECVGKDGRPIGFTVRWQFAPDTRVKRLDDRRFLLKRRDAEIELRVGDGWWEVKLVEMDADRAAADASADFEGIVSPAFRKIVRAPYLKLIARPDGSPGLFTTTFVA